MGVSFTDDGKGKWQSVSASLTLEWQSGHGFDHLDLFAFGADKAEARDNLLASLAALQVEVANGITATSSSAT